MSIVMVGSTSGSITLQEPAVAGTTTINLPATSGTALVAPTALTVPNTTGTVMVSGNMPAFSAYHNTNQGSFTSGSFTKVQFNTEEFDTNNNFASNTFTPTVAGYYQLNAALQYNNTSASSFAITLYKNGSRFKDGAVLSMLTANGIGSNLSTLVYANGTTDYFEIYLFQNSGGTITLVGTDAWRCYFQGSMVRGT